MFTRKKRIRMTCKVKRINGNLFDFPSDLCYIFLSEKGVMRMR